MVLSDQIVEARVKKIIWTPSKDGFVKPRIQIDSIKICGATITYATAHNAAFIYNNFIGPGAVVQMIRSGDVIPKVHKVIAPVSKPKGPPNSLKVKWNKTKVDLVLENKEDNEIVQLTKSRKFLPKVPFGELVEQGVIPPGAVLTDKTEKYRAKVKVDGSLKINDISGSIHQVGAKLQGLPSCNGWDYWHLKNKSRTILLDVLRDQYRNKKLV